jgi:hypothetical protein
LELTAFWTMFLDGYIGAPPTFTVFSLIDSAEAGIEASRRVATAADASRLKRDMGSS